MSDSKPHAVLRKGSPLWSVFSFLRNRGSQGATSAELATAFEGHNTNISTTIADIRKCLSFDVSLGYVMLPARFVGRSPAGRKLYRYWLVRTSQVASVEVAEDQQPSQAQGAADPRPPCSVPGSLFNLHEV